MRIGILLLLLVLYSTNLNAQIGRTYNEHINKAEIHITEEKYKEALKKYNTAFTDTKLEFAADLYNACVCADKLNDTSKVLAYADKLASKGVGGKFFSKGIFKDYIRNNSFQNIIQKAEQVKAEKLLINKDYNEDLKEFSRLDSIYNKLRLTEFNDSFEIPDTLENLFRENTRNLLNYIKINGYYSENKLGTDISKDTIIRYIRRPDIVFLHYLEMGSDKALLEDIKNMLLQNLDDGIIKPYHITGIVELANNIFGDTGSWLYNIDECNIYKRKEIQERDKINKNRKLYLMDSLEDFDKKIGFKYFTNTHFDFKYNIIRSGIHDKDQFATAFHPIATAKNCLN